MKRVFNFICILTAASAAFVLVVSKTPSVGRVFLHEEDSGSYSGDLYNKCLIDAFKGNMVKKELGDYREDSTLETADAILIGDSFSTTALDSDVLPVDLEKATGLQIFAANESLAIDSPLAYLEKAGYRRGRRKPLILVTVERHSLDRVATYSVDDFGRGAYPALQNLYTAVKNRLLIREDTAYFVTHNRLVFPVYRRLKNIRFAMFGEIDDANVPLYSRNPPMLFYRAAVDFNRKVKTAAQLDAAAASVALLSRELRKRYDLDLIYVIVPNKYSIYHDVLAGDAYRYDDFIPEMRRRLVSAGVRAVDLYTKYAGYRKSGGSALLYYPSDTHWTPLGKSFLIEELRVDLIKN